MVQQGSSTLRAYLMRGIRVVIYCTLLIPPWFPEWMVSFHMTGTREMDQIELPKVHLSTESGCPPRELVWNSNHILNSHPSLFSNSLSAWRSPNSEQATPPNLLLALCANWRGDVVSDMYLHKHDNACFRVKKMRLIHRINHLMLLKLPSQNKKVVSSNLKLWSRCLWEASVRHISLVLNHHSLGEIFSC